MLRRATTPGQLAALFGVAMLASGCTSTDPDDAHTADRDLIGGDVTQGQEIPATVGISQGGRHACTAARVGPRHLLTAAHCVFSAGNLTVHYDPTHDVELRLGDGRRVTYKVKEAHVHPSWTSKCAETLCSVSAVTAKLDAADVAVLELEEEPQEVAVAAVDRAPLSPGDHVRLTGFGCTTGVHVTDGNVATQLRTADQDVVGPAAAVHDGSFVTAADEPIYSGNYALTAGTAGLCPGDSGGPLYRLGAGAPTVVGVNANYTLLPDDKDEVGLPVTNWHTRLDGTSRNHVGDWLSQVGVP